MSSISEQIQTYAWQNSMIEEHNFTKEPAVIAISPSQFRSILSCPARCIEFAVLTLRHIRTLLPNKRLIVLIADQIQRYSIAVFEHKNGQRAQETAAAQGKKIRQIFEEACMQLQFHDSQMIEIIQWNDIRTSGTYDLRVEHIQHYAVNIDPESHRLIDEV